MSGKHCGCSETLRAKLVQRSDICLGAENHKTLKCLDPCTPRQEGAQGRQKGRGRQHLCMLSHPSASHG